MHFVEARRVRPPVPPPPPFGVAASLRGAAAGGPRLGVPFGAPACWRAVRPARAAYSAALAVSYGDWFGSIQFVSAI